ncbi:hypothetical protein [Actinoplanes sp. NPDC051494]|uniref:hypothetical protein n=1 Tax=Actinoplanes sp. NPDC051494 TaxID=3363907 RepID=UPI0037AAD2E1
MSSDLERAVHDLLVEGLTDWVPVDQIIDIAREIAARSSYGFVDIARNLITTLIQDDLMMPGDIGSEGFERWAGVPEDLIARVVNQCQDMDWLPQGAGCWLANTDIGNRLAVQ